MLKIPPLSTTCVWRNVSESLDERGEARGTSRHIKYVRYRTTVERRTPPSAYLTRIRVEETLVLKSAVGHGAPNNNDIHGYGRAQARKKEREAVAQLLHAADEHECPKYESAHE